MFSSLFEYLLTRESCERRIISHEKQKDERKLTLRRENIQEQENMQ